MLENTPFLGTLHVTASNQSLSSYLVSAENKSSRSTRLISFREDNSERSIFSSSRSRLGRESGQAFKAVRRSVLEEANSSVSTEVARGEAGNSNDGMSAFNRRLPSLLRAYTMLIPTLIRLSVDCQGRGEVYFTLREYLEGCSSSEIDAMFLILSHLDANKYSTVLKLLAPQTVPQEYSVFLRNARKIGDGAFGVVYQIVSNSLKFAVKVIPREQTAEDSFKFTEVYNEVRCLQLLQRSRSGPSYVDCHVDSSSYLIVMECGVLSVGEWRRQLGTIENPQQTLRLLLLIYKEMISVVELIHSVGIVHCDIKCDNFILRRLPQVDDDASHFKDILFAVDFGESVILGTHYSSRSRGTLQAQSPMMLSLNGSDNKASGDAKLNNVSCADDIWSCGCMLYEVLVGEFLFADKSWADLYMLLVAAEDFQAEEMVLGLFLLKVPFAIDLVSNLANLIGKILRKDATMRLSFKDIQTGIAEALCEICSLNCGIPADISFFSLSFCVRHFTNILDRIRPLGLCKLPRGVIPIADNLFLSLGNFISTIKAILEPNAEYNFLDKEGLSRPENISIFSSVRHSSTGCLRSASKKFETSTVINLVGNGDLSHLAHLFNQIASNKLYVAVIEGREEDSKEETVVVPNSAIHSLIWSILNLGDWNVVYSQNLQWLCEHVVAYGNDF